MIIKNFNLKFRIELRWPFTFKKNDKEDQPHVPRVSEIQVSSTHHGVPTTEQIKIDSDGVRFTKKSGYTEPDKRYSEQAIFGREYWENKEATGSGNRPVVRENDKTSVQIDTEEPQQKYKGVYQKSLNYYKIIELKHDGLPEEQIAQKLNLSLERVRELWNDYTKISLTHKNIYSNKALQNVPQPNKKLYTHYDKKFIADVVAQALNTSRTEVLNRYNLPETTLRQWIRRYEQSIQENKE